MRADPRGRRTIPAGARELLPRGVGRFLRRSWAALAVGSVATGVAVAAVAQSGLPASDTHLDAAQVYVVNTGASLVGAVNTQIDDLAQSATVGGTSYTLTQDADHVLVTRTRSNEIEAYDPATNQPGTPLVLPRGAATSYGGGTLAVVTPDSGKVWSGPVDEMLKSDFQKVPASMDLGADGQAVATATGDVIGVSVDRMTVVHPAAGGDQESALPWRHDQSSTTPHLSLSAVGDRLVVLNADAGQVWVEGWQKPLDLSGADAARLLPPVASLTATDGQDAVVATSRGLVGVSSGGTRLLTPQQDGVATTPVQVGDCLYGVNATTLVTACHGRQPTAQIVPGLTDATNLHFQANRDAVVLNRDDSGDVWLVQKGLKHLKDWSHVAPAASKGDNTSADDNRVDLAPHKKNHPPVVPANTTFYARVGEDTTVPVLDACTDADGDILTVSDVRGAARGMTTSITGGGTGLQVTLPKGASGRYGFDYTVSDGVASASGHATIEAESADLKVADHAPRDLHPTRVLQVGSGRTAHRQLFDDWRDPDGDGMVLTGAKVQGTSGDTVSFSPDGSLTFTDVGRTTGDKKVLLTVSDTVRTVNQVLVVHSSASAVAPVANGDFVRTTAGTDTLIRPLDNDEGSPLALTQVAAESSEVHLTNRFSEGAVVFNAARPGQYYLTYTVTSGRVATGRIRVDVVGQDGHNSPPSVARDVVLLPPSPAKELLDPLANDTDPDNDVLVVQDVTQDPALDLSLSDGHLVQLRWNRMPDHPVVLTYTVSDGQRQVQGTIEVVPVTTVDSTQPQAEPDTLHVRAGYTGTVDVLANDTSPLGLDLTVSKLVLNPGGHAWIEDNKLRVAVPAKMGGTSFTVEYQVADSEHRTDVGFVEVVVTTADAPNDPPVPQTVEARVLSGPTVRPSVRIPIPLDGIDPNGDAVTLRGLAGSPTRGRITGVGDGYLEYQAMPEGSGGTGTDTFSYQVVDALGATATGTIRVGIAPTSATNSAPVAASDAISVRPGRRVTLNLLANDYDVDGDAIRFASRTAVTGLPGNPTTDSATSMTLTAPTRPGTWSGVYSIVDGRGMPATGQVTLTVSPTAPLAAPVAHDDVASLTDADPTSWIVVDVRANDTDADGPVTALRVSTTASADLAVVDAQQRLHVHVGQLAQQVRYKVTDADGNSAEATVTIPGRADDVPHLKKAVTLSVPAGENLPIDLNTYVVGSAGRGIQLTSTSRVGSVGGSVAGVTTKTITFTGDAVGPAAVAFEVMDAVPASQHPRTSWLTIPITVTRPPAGSAKKGATQPSKPVNLAPQGPNPTLSVGVGEPATTMDLSLGFADPEGDGFRFGGWKACSANGLQVAFDHDGHHVTASAPLGTKVGARTTCTGLVTDGPGANAPVTLTVVASRSTRPLPTTVADTATAKAGESVSVDVLANDRSNLLNNTQLTLVGTPSVVSGSARVAVQGRSVVVTPAQDFSGTVNVRYTVVDATNDPSRESDGLLTVNVTARPGAPGVPVMVSVGDRTFTVKFTPADPHGTPVTSYSYTARPVGGGGTLTGSCDVNSCVVTGATNNVPYTVSVTATNAVGTGPASGSSATITPDVKPNPPAAPTLQFADQAMDVTWSAAQTNGSPVDGYQVRLASGGSSAVRQTKGPVLTLHWTGLTNGTSYTFQVQAHNKAGWSDWSPVSAPEHPTGPAAAPTAVTGVDDATAIDGGWIDVSWLPPASQPDPVLCYHVTANGTPIGPTCLAPSGGAHDRQSLTFKTAANGTAYSFAVTAENRSKQPGPAGRTAQSVTPFGRPESPTAATVTASASGCITVDAIKVVAHGQPVSRYWLWTTPASTSGTNEDYRQGSAYCGLTNGTSYTVHVRAFAGTKASQDGVVGKVVPHGDLPAPDYSVGAAADGMKRLMYIRAFRTAVDANGWDPAAITYEYDAGGGWTAVAAGKLFAVAAPAPDGATVRVRARVGTATSPTNTATLDAPLVARSDAQGNVQVSLTAWVDDTSATCTLQPDDGSKQEKQTVDLDAKGTGSTTFAAPAAPTTAPTATATTDPTATASATDTATATASATPRTGTVTCSARSGVAMSTGVTSP